MLLVFSQARSGERKLLIPMMNQCRSCYPLRAWVTFALGLVVLILSSKLLVWGAVLVAEELGISELVIGLTVVAVGTSLPELAASVASALRGHTEIALGNIIGSNLFNLLAVMAIPGVVGGQVLDPEAISRDYASMAALTLFPCCGDFCQWQTAVNRRPKEGLHRASFGRSVGLFLRAVLLFSAVNRVTLRNSSMSEQSAISFTLIRAPHHPHGSGCSGLPGGAHRD